jgi:predicted molibdopterin-dependent oxidoreductase YjgC
MARTAPPASSSLSSLRLGSDVERGCAITVFVDDEPIEAYEGETIGAALMASGRRVLRRTPYAAAPRGLFCGMGVCFDCVVDVGGQQRVRACMAEVREGMRISTREA